MTTPPRNRETGNSFLEEKYVISVLKRYQSTLSLLISIEMETSVTFLRRDNIH